MCPIQDSFSYTWNASPDSSRWLDFSIRFLSRCLDGAEVTESPWPHSWLTKNDSTVIPPLSTGSGWEGLFSGRREGLHELVPIQSPPAPERVFAPLQSEAKAPPCGPAAAWSAAQLAAYSLAARPLPSCLGSSPTTVMTLSLISLLT